MIWVTALDLFRVRNCKHIPTLLNVQCGRAVNIITPLL
jgi:hypothetical protein